MANRTQTIIIGNIPTIVRLYEKGESLAVIRRAVEKASDDALADSTLRDFIKLLVADGSLTKRPSREKKDWARKRQMSATGQRGHRLLLYEFLAANEEKIVELHKSGISCTAIGERLSNNGASVSNTAIRNYLKKLMGKDIVQQRPTERHRSGNGNGNGNHQEEAASDADFTLGAIRTIDRLMEEVEGLRQRLGEVEPRYQESIHRNTTLQARVVAADELLARRK